VGALSGQFRGFPLDTRFMPAAGPGGTLPTGVVGVVIGAFGNPAAPPLSGAVRLRQIAAGVDVEMLAGMRITVAPGGAFYITTIVLNQTLDLSFGWRERPFRETELHLFTQVR
jgi:hypothetical protein